MLIKREVAALLLAAIGFAVYLAARRPAISDQDQILAATEDLQASMRRGSVDGVFSHVSTEFHYAGMDRRRARLSLLQFFESFSSVSLIIRNPQTRIEGDTAEMNVDADIEAAPGQTASPQTIYHHPIDITWTREIGRRMLVFPTSTWRITQITGPSPSADEAS